MTSIRLELYLSEITLFHTQKDNKNTGQYGCKCEDLVSLTFYLIHSIRSVTTITIAKNILPPNIPQNNFHSQEKKIHRNEKSSDYVNSEKYGNDQSDVEVEPFLGYHISEEVNEGCLSAVSAHGHYVVLHVVAAAMNWSIQQMIFPNASIRWYSKRISIYTFFSFFFSLFLFLLSYCFYLTYL